MGEYYPVVYYICFYILSSKAFQLDGAPGLFGVVFAWFLFMLFVF